MSGPTGKSAYQIDGLDNGWQGPKLNMTPSELEYDPEPFSPWPRGVKSETSRRDCLPHETGAPGAVPASGVARRGAGPIQLPDQ